VSEAPWRERLEAVVRQAGEHLAASFERLGEDAVERKATAIDLVTPLDRESQALLEAGLRREFPGEAILAEEDAGARRAARGPLWLVDPLDGTTNFVHGVPLFTISVARVRDGSLDRGMIYAPCLGELYWCARGAGAWRGSQRLAVSRRAALQDALLCSGFPYDIRTEPHNNLREWSHLARRCRGLRRTGAASLDLAWVAAGRFDGFWEFRLGPWDLAAGALMVQEAGGSLTDPRGGTDFLWQGDVVASNGTLHAQLLQALAEAQNA